MYGLDKQILPAYIKRIVMRNESIVSQKENWAPLERRLSLKYSSAVQNKNNPRMSIPMRRESLATTSGVSPFSDISNYRDMRPSFTSVASVQLHNKPAKKEAILTNLICKLDHEEQLKEIIHNKIRNGRRKETYSCFDGCESTEIMESKLRCCQQQIECFKDLVHELVEKISSLQNNSNTSRIPSPAMNRRSRNVFQTKQVGIQANLQASPDPKSKQHSEDMGMDFLDNLNKTLKVLSGKKMR